MKSFVSTLALGFLLIGSQVYAAPAAPAANSTSALATPASTDSAAPDSTVSSTPGDDDNAEFSNGTPNFDQMKKKYQNYIKNTLKKRKPSHSCTLDKLSVRKEWGTMSKKERIAYIDAVKCFYSKKPPLSNPAEIPGARNRFDDFVAAHIQQGQNIHFDGYLLAWHRNFVSIYEQALKKECGYKGPTPFWDWTLTPDDPRLSPVFDGSATSMSGNGESIPHGGTFVTAFGLNLTLPPGTGGGCVKDGPFANLQVNLGVNPIIAPPSSVDLTANISSVGVFASASEATVSTFRSSGTINQALKYNPRCLTRDINLFWSKQVRVKDVENLLSCPNVDCLEKRADGWEINRALPQPLLHAAGHFSVGGLQNDPFASPGDPVFYLHHAAFDRLFSIWQAQDAKNRLYQVGGTQTPFNIPASGPVTLDDTVDFGVVSKKVKLRELMSTIDGPFCYMYD